MERFLTTLSNPLAVVWTSGNSGIQFLYHTLRRLKNNYAKNIIIAVLATAFFYTLWLSGTYPQALEYVNTAFRKFDQLFVVAEGNWAAALLHRPVTVAELQNKYNSTQGKKVRVLVVPGHEPGYGGAEYGSLKEREMTVELSQYLGQLLKNNGHFDVMLSRDNNNWSPTFMEYFIKQWDPIITFYKENKEDNLKILHASLDTPHTPSPGSGKGVQHVAARTDVALRLYGINKWENENAVDIAIHVHFNDYPGHAANGPGKYSGFAMYVPEKQYANSTTTRAVAESVFKRLSKYNAVSNLPLEDEGIVDESELIAIGAYNTTNSASMLIEYGYIYEPQFQNDDVRHSTLRDLAFQTYLGLQDFFGSGNDVSFAYDTLMLPHSWEGNVSADKASTSDVLALQSALLLDGFYPGEGKTKNDCPRSGNVGPCTLAALKAFQKRYGITGEDGVMGPKTRLLLNGKYSIKSI
jgi:N-acetylmuramoyl-L-alanine amidase